MANERFPRREQDEKDLGGKVVYPVRPDTLVRLIEGGRSAMSVLGHDTGDGQTSGVPGPTQEWVPVGLQAHVSASSSYLTGSWGFTVSQSSGSPTSDFARATPTAYWCLRYCLPCLDQP